MKLEPLVLELYRQLTHFLFNLEAKENRKTGQISIQPEVRLLVTKVWNDIWRTGRKEISGFFKKKGKKDYLKVV